MGILLRSIRSGPMTNLFPETTGEARPFCTGVKGLAGGHVSLLTYTTWSLRCLWT